MSRQPRRPAVTSLCAHCGKPFSHKASQENATYCSVNCKAEHIRTKPKATPRPCSHCGNVFTPSRKRGDAKWCSPRCIAVGTNAVERIAEPGKIYAAIRAATQRGTGTKGYVKVGGRHEHRVVMEKIIGRPLKFEDVVHHKDENKHNNSPDNLVLTTRPEHMQMHGMGIPGVKPAWLHKK